ncbi:MAG: permease, partial [Mycobacterium sp.]
MTSVAVETNSTRLRVSSMHVFVATIVGLAFAGGTLRSLVTGTPDVATAATVFCGIFVQALPFLALGVMVSGAVAALVTPERLARWLPRRPTVAVVAAGVSGAALPGCECGSVPIARRLFGAGTVGAAALTFMLAAPAINPIVLVSTAVAFPGEPMMVLARCVASLLTA